MGQLVNLKSKLNLLKIGLVKTNLKRVSSFSNLDPKPSDLAVSRLKIP